MLDAGGFRIVRTVVESVASGVTEIIAYSVYVEITREFALALGLEGEIIACPLTLTLPCRIHRV